MYMLDSDQEPSYNLSKNLLLLPRILKLIEDMVDPPSYSSMKESKKGIVTSTKVSANFSFARYQSSIFSPLQLLSSVLQLLQKISHRMKNSFFVKGIPVLVCYFIV